MRRLVWAFAGRTYQIVGNLITAQMMIFKFKANNFDANQDQLRKGAGSSLIWVHTLFAVAILAFEI